MRILVSGLLNIETTVAVRGFPIEYQPIDYPFFGVNSAVSGVGYNIAKAITTLGGKVDLVSFLGGDDEAERITKQLCEDGIDCAGIRRRLLSTPASVVLYDPDGKRRIYCDLKDIQDQSLDPCELLNELKGCDLAALCNINFNRELIKEARRMGVTTATDVHVLSDIEDGYNRDFMENADILFLSDEGLSEAPEAFIRRLYGRYGNKIIVLGMGSKGAVLYDTAADKMSMIPAYKNAAVVNTVGAGDALFSAFLYFYAKERDAESALKKAVVFAGIKIGSNGASKGFCSESELLRRMSENQ